MTNMNGTNGTNGTRPDVLDALIVGGGPAGSTAANLLAHAGHDVLVLEKEIFPRFHIGESLLPIDLPIFERLGVVLDYKDFIRKDGAEFIDERTGATATFVFREGLNGTPKNAYQVERSRFDHVLLKQAEARGAKVRYGVKVEEMTVEADHVRIDTTEGVFRARYMVDATGQDAFLARANRTVQPLKGFGCIAVFRHYDGLAPEIFAELTESGNIKVLMVPDGWMWLIPLAGPRLSVGIVSRHPMSAPFERLDEAIAASPITQRLIAGAVGTEPRIIRNFSYRNRRPYGPRWGCAGDASCFLDPVFSSGVSLAMLAGESLAGKLSAALRAGTEDNPELLAEHAKRMEVGYKTFAGIVYRFYHAELVHRLFFQDTQGQPLRPGITSVLGADFWRDDNPFQQMLLNSLTAEAWPDASEP